MDDLGKEPVKYKAPEIISPVQSLDEEMMLDANEKILMSRRVLEDLCRGRDVNSLPTEVRQFAQTMEDHRSSPVSVHNQSNGHNNYVRRDSEAGQGEQLKGVTQLQQHPACKKSIMIFQEGSHAQPEGKFEGEQYP